MNTNNKTRSATANRLNVSICGQLCKKNFLAFSLITGHKLVVVSYTMQVVPKILGMLGRPTLEMGSVADHL